MLKRRDGATYLFAVAMRGEPTTATFTVGASTGRATAEVLGENRTVGVSDGVFEDDFSGRSVHLYRIRGD